MKAIDILKRFRFKYQGCQTNSEKELTEAIEEIEDLIAKNKLLAKNFRDASFGLGKL